MVKLNRVILAVFLFLLTQLPVFASQELPSKSEIEQILKERVEKYEQTVGIVVGIVNEEGSKIYSYGKSSTDSNKKVDGDTLFEIGSITKTFTSTLLADMAAGGEVDLDDSVTKYLPSSVKVPSRNGKEITLRHLATHTSGLPRMPDNFKPADPDNPYADYTVEDMYSFLSGCTLTRDIGEKFEYSNFGAGLLGHILSLKAGTDYETLVTKRILKPLKMKSTVITLSPKLKKRMATGHNGGLEAVSNWDISTLEGAGALRSTANDMLKYIAANLGLKKTKLFPAMQKTHEPQADTGTGKAKTGLAWHILDNDSNPLVLHGGGTGGFRTFAGFNPAGRTGVVVLTNSTKGADDIGLHLLDPEKPLMELKLPKKEAVISTEVYKDYIGEYELAAERIFTVTEKDSKLYVQLTGQAALHVFPESESKFFLKAVDAQISFVRNDEGRVTHLVLHQMGVDQRAEKRKEPGVSLNKRKEITLRPEVLKRYVGEYQLTPQAVFSITINDNKLFAQLTGQPAFQIFPETENQFFLKVVNAQIRFNLSDAGEAESLILFQNGREMPAQKIDK